MYVPEIFSIHSMQEKDDANFKLMSERIKSNSIHKLLLEEKELLHGQLNAMAAERQRQEVTAADTISKIFVFYYRYLELVSQLEERERNTESTIQGLDKELSLQQQANESHRKRAEESLQELTKAQLQTNEQQKMMENIHQTLASRTEECERESLSYKRCVCTYGIMFRCCI